MKNELRTLLRQAKDRLAKLAALADPAMAYQARMERFYVRRADGRLAHPVSRSYVSESDLPPDADVWSVLDAFAHPALKRTSDGQPGRAESYQLEFLLKDTPHSLFLGGVRSGKSVVGCMRAYELALLNPGGTTIAGAPSNKGLWVNLIPRFERYLPVQYITVPDFKHTNGKYGVLNRFGYYEVLWFNGHRTVFVTLEEKSDSVMKIQGPDACGLWLDEASIMSEKTYHVFSERLSDESGMLRQEFITTSRDKPGWLERTFIGPDVDRTVFAITEADTESATFRTENYIREQQKILSKKEYARKIKNQAVIYEGLVYEGYLSQDIKDPCWSDRPIDFNRPKILAVDFGFQRGSALLLDRDEATDCLYVEDELHTVNCTVEQFAALVLSECRSDKNPKGWIISHIWTDYSNESDPDRKVFIKYFGAIVKPALRRGKYWGIRQGLDLVRARCLNAANERHLYVHVNLHQRTENPDVTTFWEEIGNYRYNKIEDGKPIDERPIKDGKEHVFDALRYGVIGEYAPRGTPG